MYTQDEWNEYIKDCDPKGSKHWWFWMFFEKSATGRGIKIHYPCWVAKRVGAVAVVFGNGVGYIRMRDNIWFMKKMLLRHEIGHILGFGHTWAPIIMNPTRFFRWFLLPKVLWGKIEIVD